MANNTLVASDNWAGGSLAAGWSPLFGLSTCQVVGSAPKVTEPNALSTVAGQIWTGTTFPNDQISEVTIQSFGDTSSFVSLQVRFATGSYSGYQLNLSTSAANCQLLRYASGVSTVLKTFSVAAASGDVWSLMVVGSYIMVYQNGKQIWYQADTTYSSGAPGFSQYTTTNVANTKVAAWRGYSMVQQDGVWTKSSVVFPALSGDLAGSNIGPTNTSNILYEGNAQLLSGTVYKTWLSVGQGAGGAGGNIWYAESTDGVNWTRSGAAVLSGFITPYVVNNAGTYYMYVQSATAAGTGAFQLYTSSNGTSWTLNNNSILTLGTSGQWDDTFLWAFNVVDQVAGTWYALYSAGHNTTSYAFSTGLATSSDGITWTKYVSNPVLTGYTSPAVVKVNGTYYNWTTIAQPGQGQVHPNEDPAQTVRWQSTDLKTWTNRTPSFHTSQMYESVNGQWGQCYPNALVNVGGSTYAYLTSALNDSGSGPSTQLLFMVTLATAPTNLSSLVQFNEDACPQVASDSFTGGLGNWTTPTGGTALQIASNKLEPTATATKCVMCYTGASFGNDQYSEVTIASLGASSFIYPVVRAQTGSIGFYELVITGPSGAQNTGGCAIYKNVSGTETLISFGGLNQTPQVGDVIRLAVVGNVLSAYQNGFLIMQAQDNNNTFTSGHPGVQAYATTSVTNAQVSLWAGGNANTLPSYSNMSVGSYLAGPLSVTMTNANGNSLLISGESVSGTFGHPLPVVFTDINGNEYTVTGQSAGAFVAAPLPVVLCTAAGLPVTPPIVITSNGNTITISSSLSGKTTGAPIPVVLTQAGNQFVLSGFPLGSFARNPLPVVLTDLNGNGVSISNIAT